MPSNQSETFNATKYYRPRPAVPSTLAASAAPTVPDPAPIFAQKVVDRCHVELPGESRPTSAICYEGQFYVFVRTFPTVEAAQQKAALMRQKGNDVILTRVPKGLVMWVLELDAQPVQPVSARRRREF